MKKKIRKEKKITHESFSHKRSRHWMILLSIGTIIMFAGGVLGFMTYLQIQKSEADSMLQNELAEAQTTEESISVNELEIIITNLQEKEQIITSMIDQDLDVKDPAESSESVSIKTTESETSDDTSSLSDDEPTDIPS